MIPVWILTLLHYLSLTAAVVVTALIGWHYLRPQHDATSTTETERERDDTPENG